MIICQNCGTTNNEKLTKTCRTCGALLPVTSKSSRKKKKKEEKQRIEPVINEGDNSAKIEEEQLDLHDIPGEEVSPKNIDLQEIPFSSVEEEQKEENEPESREVLQEIPAPPYRGSSIDSRVGVKALRPIQPSDAISDAFSELKNSLSDDQNEYQEAVLKPIPSEKAESEESIKKRNRLEKDMTDVLSFLSKKISVKKLDLPKVKESEEKEPLEAIAPSSMNEILNRLISLDLNIEASAIIKTDGTILASAISSRISDSLFTTIGMNLSMIGTDIIEGLGAGTLKSISLKATEGVLDLAPIDKENPSVKDMFLIIFSHPKVKSGIISFAVNIVKKQLKEYLGLKK
ncbi:MAG: hypothetical protein ACFFA0_00985 [Promethearchaeota archaeon]